MIAKIQVKLNADGVFKICQLLAYAGLVNRVAPFKLGSTVNAPLPDYLAACIRAVSADVTRIGSVGPAAVGIMIVKENTRRLALIHRKEMTGSRTGAVCNGPGIVATDFQIIKHS